eukprot:COSAG02_NODE_1781_length_10947_cov_54.689159_7_plen_39_part_00
MIMAILAGTVLEVPETDRTSHTVRLELALVFLRKHMPC